MTVTLEGAIWVGERVAGSVVGVLTGVFRQRNGQCMVKGVEKAEEKTQFSLPSVLRVQAEHCWGRVVESIHSLSGNLI